MVDIAVNAPMRSDTGSNLPSICENVLNAAKDTTVLVPVYGDKSGSGNGGWYKITGWAAFTLLGWNFPSSNYNKDAYPGATCSNPCRGLIGKFVNYVSLDDRFTPGGPNLGAPLVTLTR
jgi:hypothetical protein